jgi:hypothetical protein
VVVFANRLNLSQSARFNIPYRGLAKEAFALAIELTRALIPYFERCTGCIKPLDEHLLSGSNQSKLFLVLKWAHRRQGAEVMVPLGQSRVELLARTTGGVGESFGQTWPV